MKLTQLAPRTHYLDSAISRDRSAQLLIVGQTPQGNPFISYGTSNNPDADTYEHLTVSTSIHAKHVVTGRNVTDLRSYPVLKRFNEYIVGGNGRHTEPILSALAKSRQEGRYMSLVSVLAEAFGRPTLPDTHTAELEDLSSYYRIEEGERVYYSPRISAVTDGQTVAFAMSKRDLHSIKAVQHFSSYPLTPGRAYALTTHQEEGGLLRICDGQAFELPITELTTANIHDEYASAIAHSSRPSKVSFGTILLDLETGSLEQKITDTKL